MHATHFGRATLAFALHLAGCLGVASDAPTPAPTIDAPRSRPEGFRLRTLSAQIRGAREDIATLYAADDAAITAPPFDAGRPVDASDAERDAPLETPPIADACATDCECGSEIEQRVIALANDTRRARDLPILECDRALTAAARAHSEDMCARGFFGHLSPDGTPPQTRATRAGARFLRIGENIAAGPADALDVHREWLASPTHRTNLLNATYVRVGVGYAACFGVPRWTADYTD